MVRLLTAQSWLWFGPCLLLHPSLLHLILLYVECKRRSGHVETLLALKSSVDPFDSLQWKGTNVCAWKGIKECLNGRVTKLVLEHLNLSGSLDEQSLNRLDLFRVLSFKTNSISGQIPDLSSLVNLKSLFLNESNFRRIPRVGSPVEFQLLYSNSDDCTLFTYKTMNSKVRSRL
ncbi:hypothetical protein V6N13_146150 [Hibiscus sabdariffa]